MFILNDVELLFPITSFYSTIKIKRNFFFSSDCQPLWKLPVGQHKLSNTLCDLADAKSRWYITTLDELLCSGKQRIAKILLRTTSIQTVKERRVTVVCLRIIIIYHCIYSRQLARECCRHCHYNITRKWHARLRKQSGV